METINPTASCAGAIRPPLRACITHGKRVRPQHRSFFEGDEIGGFARCFAFEASTAAAAADTSTGCDAVLHLTANPKGDETAIASADLSALVGDEMCQLRSADALQVAEIGAVQMHSGLQATDAARIYIPLGPHRVFAERAIVAGGRAAGAPASSRRLLFSVTAAMTGGRGKHLTRAVEPAGLAAALPKHKWFVHLVGRQVDPGSPEAARKNRKGGAYLSPQNYSL
jgi:hypothetical protein